MKSGLEGKSPVLLWLRIVLKVGRGRSPCFMDGSANLLVMGNRVGKEFSADSRENSRDL